MAQDTGPRIVIDVQNHIVTDNQTGKGSGGAIGPNGKVESGLNQDLKMLSVMETVRALQRLGTALSANNDELREVIAKVGKAVRYGNLASRAVKGMAVSDFGDLIKLGINLAVDAIIIAQEASSKVASIQNSADAAAVDAGVLDISDANLNKSSWNGRWTYSGR